MVAHKKPQLDWHLHCWIEMTDGSIRDPDSDSRIETAFGWSLITLNT